MSKLSDKSKPGVRVIRRRGRIPVVTKFIYLNINEIIEEERNYYDTYTLNLTGVGLVSMDTKTLEDIASGKVSVTKVLNDAGIKRKDSFIKF